MEKNNLCISYSNYSHPLKVHKHLKSGSYPVLIHKLSTSYPLFVDKVVKNKIFPQPVVSKLWINLHVTYMSIGRGKRCKKS